MNDKISIQNQHTGSIHPIMKRLFFQVEKNEKISFDRFSYREHHGARGTFYLCVGFGRIKKQMLSDYIHITAFEIPVFYEPNGLSLILSYRIIFLF